MKQYICDKCHSKYYEEKKINNGNCIDTMEPCVAEHPGLNQPYSTLRYNIDRFLDQSGDFCPGCKYLLYEKIYLIVQFLESKEQ